MKLENVDGFSFDFTDALTAFVFDEKNGSKITFHGAPMKAVDIIVELQDAYLFIEIKNYDDPVDYDTRIFVDVNELDNKQEHFNFLKNNLKYKYRDSCLYRYAEDKVDKPIHYLCLVNFENALNLALQKALKRELPVGIVSKRWKREIAVSCHVLNLGKWNKLFPKWPVVKITENMS
jgi:hypothetical protein